MKILPYGEDPSLIETLGPAFVSETGDKTLRVRIKSSAGKLLLAEVEGCSDRDVAQSLRGTELWYEREMLPELDEEDGFYHEDLVGLTVIEDGQEIGVVCAVDNFGASDLIEIRPKNGNSYYIPFVDEYVLNIDLEAQIVTVQDSASLRLE